jgi:transcription-repair coupling factor (superfamily II helicase)
MEVYRKIAVAKNSDDLRQIESELVDVYGPIPDEVKLLLEWAEFRIAASRLNIKSIVTSNNNLIFSFAKGAKINTNELFANIRGKVEIVEPTTIYLRLSKNYFEPNTLMTLLRKILIK